jgi:hypothetical protein
MVYMYSDPQRLTQVGILRALTWPGFFLSTFLGSRVTQPAADQLVSDCLKSRVALSLGNAFKHV